MITWTIAPASYYIPVSSLRGPSSGPSPKLCVSHTSLLPPIHLGPPEALFLYWRQGKCLLGPKCQPPIHKNHIVAVLNGLAAKPSRHGRGWHHFWARLASMMGEAGTTFGRGWFLCGQPRPRHMPYRMFRWHFSGRGWLHLNQPRPIQVPLGTHCTQKCPETCSASTEKIVGPGPNGKLVPVKKLTVN